MKFKKIDFKEIADNLRATAELCDRLDQIDINICPGPLIKKAREAKGLTREELAQKVCYSTGSYSHFFYSKMLQAVEDFGQTISMEDLIRIGFILELDIRRLATLEKLSRARSMYLALDRSFEKEFERTSRIMNEVVT
jgi:transcriptional regulator with XRE-family HTH domain